MVYIRDPNDAQLIKCYYIPEKHEKRESEHSPNSRYNSVEREDTVELYLYIEEVIQQEKKRNQPVGAKRVVPQTQ